MANTAFGNDAALPVDLLLDSRAGAEFNPLLHKGVKIGFDTGAAVSGLLCEQMGIDPDFLADRIQTIFLDYKVVDQAETAMLHDGCVLALSAALPGLAGASLRKGGILKSLRSGISYEQEQDRGEKGRGRMTLKLFNLLMNDLGPAVLGHGIYLSESDLREFLASRGDDLLSLCRGAKVDGREITAGQMASLDWLPPGREVRLKAVFN